MCCAFSVCGFSKAILVFCLLLFVTLFFFVYFFFYLVVFCLFFLLIFSEIKVFNEENGIRNLTESYNDCDDDGDVDAL